jgi:MFS family permease
MVVIMPIRPLSGKLAGVFTRPALISIFLLSNAFVWYSYTIVILQESIGALNLDFLPNMAVWSSHFAALIVSALLGTYLTKKLGGRNRFMTIWVLVGSLASFAPIALSTTGSFGSVVLGLVIGFSLGFGLPNCMGYFTSRVPVENRGRIGGVIILVTGVGTAGLDLIGINGLVELTITLVVLRAIALAAVAFTKQSLKLENGGRLPSYRAILNQRPFILYFVPWIMFALLSYLATPVQQNILDPAMFSNLQILENVFMGAFALVGGIFMDLVGRKRLAIIGFVMLGLSYSILGFFNNTAVWYLHVVMNGMSWGVLYVLFVMTIWGDLSHGAASDKFYALGASPFFISKMLQLTINSQIVAAIPITAIFSFTALFLFLAVLPLIYSPETLPEKIMKARELKTYLEKAQEIATRTQNKEVETEQCKNEDEDDGLEFRVNQEDDEEARELAEKYY